tara:strand:+ start:51 stop:257 length:207 start_codon:yes stop_codon:yes gene_type:complete
MDIEKYTELSQKLIDHYISINDYKMAFTLLVNYVSNINEKNYRNNEEIKKFTNHYKSVINDTPNNNNI